MAECVASTSTEAMKVEPKDPARPLQAGRECLDVELEVRARSLVARHVNEANDR